MSGNPREILPIAALAVGDDNGQHAQIAVPQEAFDTLTRNFLTHEVKKEVNGSIAAHTRKFDRKLMEMERTIARECSTAWQHEVPKLSKRTVEEYMEIQLPSLINKEMQAIFPIFLSNNTKINGYLDDHLKKIDSMITSRQNEIQHMINEIAKDTADKMTNTSKFGHIYEALQRSSNKVIASEALKVRGDVVALFEDEVSATRRQREQLVDELAKMKLTYNKYIETQRIYQNISLAGAALSIVGLAVSVCHTMWRK